MSDNPYETNPVFTAMPKIPRLSRNCTVTEKIDGTNASIFIGDDDLFLVGSRTRWITPTDDNYGFARWAHEHKEELMQLGPGHNFGEWWGLGIQRGYGLKEKRFSLFNTNRWADNDGAVMDALGRNVRRPECCSVVPVLYEGLFDTDSIVEALNDLEMYGSKIAPGFMDPEGIVIYHHAAKQLFKKTIKNDEKPKGSKE
jgi:RNA ligase-like protein